MYFEELLKFGLYKNEHIQNYMCAVIWDLAVFVKQKN